MDKNYIYIGMLVGYNDVDCLVIDKQKDTCTLLIVHNRTYVGDVQYSLITPINDAKAYNNRMRNIGSRKDGRLCKNNDTEYIFNDGSKVWFTSDTHFFHDNVLHFCKRPFADVESMNEYLISKWNDNVKCDDTIFHLGDFAWGGSDNWKSILSRLNGHIHLIIGNHDVKNLRANYNDYFESISFQRQIIVEGRSIYLNHYPMLTWGGIHRKPENKVWQLFGHVHSKTGILNMDTERVYYCMSEQYDVGVDNNNYEPINFNQIKTIISTQTYEK